MSIQHSSSEPGPNAPRKHDQSAWMKGGSAECMMQPHHPLGTAARIVLLGPPGIGKSHQAGLLGDRLGACHLATGEVFGAAQNCQEENPSPAVQNALDHLKRGEAIPDETVLNLIGERLRCLKCSGGFLINGFPRTVTQAKALEQLLENHGLKLTGVFNYHLPEEKLVARLSHRRTCTACRHPFQFNPLQGPVPETCPRCAGKLLQAEEDRPEVIQSRTEAYLKAIQPLIQFYQQQGLLFSISADGSPEEVFQRTRLTALAR